MYKRQTISHAAVTGYGEELMKHAFHLDIGVVETMAHYQAAKHFNPNVDFIIDIGGQDMKCFRIKDNSIDDILLNEACSSGCGSFIETFAKSMGYEIKEFARMGLHGKHPVDLGTRLSLIHILTSIRCITMRIKHSMRQKKTVRISIVCMKNEYCSKR